MAAAALVQCTFYGNGAPHGGNISSDCFGEVTLSECIVASSASGVGVYGDSFSDIEIECTDIHGNAGGDWVGSIEELLGQNGNISADPLFCDPGNGDFTLAEGSPCLPDFNPGCGLMGAHGIGCGSPAGFPPSQALANGIRLYPNYPNPFNPRTEVFFSARQGEQITVTVLNVRGQQVAELFDGRAEGDLQSVAWNAAGQASGVYFVRAVSGSGAATRKVMLIK